MTTILILLLIGGLAVAPLLMVHREGRGHLPPPASHERDGEFLPPASRLLLH